MPKFRVDVWESSAYRVASYTVTNESSDDAGREACNAHPAASHIVVTPTKEDPQ